MKALSREYEEFKADVEKLLKKVRKIRKGAEELKKKGG